MIDEATLNARAAALDLTIPVDCQPGVLENLALLARYQKLVLSLDLPERTEPALEYHP
ncbi:MULTISPECIES: DUF4089 domain-containing protein [Asaia]|uniref:DUF4089 domain-containing protein n=1 Tax=Asaia bogorensis TaxID=91915 RepID=A0A060QC28_9PROT|nr:MULTISPECIES: DUF4089 domain-containing protein [Asaia]ETC98685.1 hypothetical protein P792_07235 [Asaia sp. SF2.1]MDL2169980.1 DUF4089 domain-containing protein [Asaia sp. HumB]CDG38208.1 hypothetical protein ASAP_0163 [Asaia bogorensis]